MSEWIMTCMNQFGYLGIALLLLLETVFPPIPSELILAFGGFMTLDTQMELTGVVIASTIGALLGALLLYGAGRCISVKRLEAMFGSKPAHLLRFKKEDVQRAILWFEKKGSISVFFCRFVPVLRSLISIPAGISHMKLLPFLLYTTLGSLLWNAVLSYAGAMLGSHYTIIVETISTYAKVIAIIIFLCAIGFWFLRKRKSVDESQ